MQKIICMSVFFYSFLSAMDMQKSVHAKGVVVPALSQKAMNSAHMLSFAEDTVRKLQLDVNNAVAGAATAAVRLSEIKEHALRYACYVQESWSAYETLTSFADSIQGLIDCLAQPEGQPMRRRDRSGQRSPAQLQDFDQETFFADAALLADAVSAPRLARVVHTSPRDSAPVQSRPICSLSWRKAQEYEAVKDRLYEALERLVGFDVSSNSEEEKELRTIIAQADQYADDAQPYSSFRESFEDIANLAQEVLSAVVKK